MSTISKKRNWKNRLRTLQWKLQDIAEEIEEIDGSNENPLYDIVMNTMHGAGEAYTRLEREVPAPQRVKDTSS